MIGVVHTSKIFEFRDEGELARALGWYGEKCGCETVIIVDTADKVKAVINRDLFTFPPDLFEEQKYYLYGNVGDDEVDLLRNDKLPAKRDWQLSQVPFAYIVQKLPKDISLY